MTGVDTTATGTTPPEETIGGWLPPHTHIARTGGGLFAAESSTTWTWTTPDGTWVVVLARPLFGASALSVRGPAGGWRFGQPDVIGLCRLHGVLVALDAIMPTDGVLTINELRRRSGEPPADLPETEADRD